MKRLRFPKTIIRIFLITALLAGVAGTTIGLLESRPAGEPAVNGYVTHRDGSVFIYDYVDASWDRVSDSLPVQATDLLRTEDNSFCEITLNDGSVLTLEENTQIEIRELMIKDRKRNVRVFLEYGNLNALVDKLSFKQTLFEIESPTAVAGVRGTEFDVSYVTEDESAVDVYDGEVEVSRLGAEGKPVERGTLNADQACSIARDREIKKMPAVSENRKSIREYFKTRIQYAKLDRSLSQLNSSIQELQVKAIKAAPPERQKIEQRLAGLYESREQMTGSRNTKAMHLSDMEERIKTIRAANKAQSMKFRQRMFQKFKDKMKQLPPETRVQIIKNRLRSLTPQQKEKILKKHPNLEKKIEKIREFKQNRDNRGRKLPRPKPKR